MATMCMVMRFLLCMTLRGGVVTWECLASAAVLTAGMWDMLTPACLCVANALQTHGAGGCGWWWWL